MDDAKAIATLRAMRDDGGVVDDADWTAAVDHAIAAIESLQDAPVAIMDTREFLSLCAPTEDDFPALYALQGQRVHLVPTPTTEARDHE